MIKDVTECRNQWEFFAKRFNFGLDFLLGSGLGWADAPASDKTLVKISDALFIYFKVIY